MCRVFVGVEKFERGGMHKGVLNGRVVHRRFDKDFDALVCFVLCLGAV